MELVFLMPVLVFGSVVLVIMFVYSLLARRPRTVKERIERYEAGIRETVLPSPEGEPSLLKDRRFSAIGWLDQALQGTRFAEKMALGLARAAVPLRVSEYILIRWLCALTLASSSLFIGHVLIGALVGGVTGFYIPEFYLKYRQQSRVKKIVGQLMDAVLLVSNSLKSGYSFGQGLELVTKEMPPPIADEFHQVLAEMRLGSNAEEALHNLTRRVPSYDIDLMVTAFVIQRQVGGNLAEVLDNIAHTIRERIRILGEVRARTSQARLSGYIVGFMPFFMMGAISLLNPSYIREMFASPLGRIILGTAFGMELVGFFLIRRIVSIEV